MSKHNVKIVVECSTCGLRLDALNGADATRLREKHIEGEKLKEKLKEAENERD